MSDELAAAELTEAEEMRAWNRDLVAARNLLSKESREANAEIMRLRADLARALPIVEAAGALVEGWIEKRERPRVERDDRWCSPQLDQRLDALARAVRMGKGRG